MVQLTFNTAGMLVWAATFSYCLYEDFSATEMELIDWNYLNNNAAGSEIGAICWHSYYVLDTFIMMKQF